MCYLIFHIFSQFSWPTLCLPLTLALTWLWSESGLKVVGQPQSWKFASVGQRGVCGISRILDARKGFLQPSQPSLVLTWQIAIENNWNWIVVVQWGPHGVYVMWCAAPGVDTCHCLISSCNSSGNGGYPRDPGSKRPGQSN